MVHVMVPRTAVSSTIDVVLGSSVKLLLAVFKHKLQYDLYCILSDVSLSLQTKLSKCQRTIFTNVYD